MPAASRDQEPQQASAPASVAHYRPVLIPGLVAPSAASAEAIDATETLRATVAAALDGFTPLVKRVMQLRFGTYDRIERSPESIAARLDMPAQQVHLIIAQTVAALEPRPIADRALRVRALGRQLPDSARTGRRANRTVTSRARRG
jgi:hypothetical protein